MRKSWTNDTVKFIPIDRGETPRCNLEITWPSSDNKTFYAFGGAVSAWDLPSPIPYVKLIPCNLLGHLDSNDIP